MTTKNPEIRIQYSHVLDPFFQELFKFYQSSLPDMVGKTYDTPEIILEKIIEFEKAWGAKESVLGYMQEVLELDFYERLIDVYVIGFFKRSISTPVIISSKKTPAIFVDTLIHEILHRLISDNIQKTPTGKILLKLYPEESLLCRNHIVLHAVLQKIYVEFFKDPKSLIAIQEKDKKFLDYNRAWEIVEQQSADGIITKFKSFYV